ncbi:stage II sporulation protein P [Anaerotignum faecicola]|nr:stage II sporulation protein P [Anaerotignum faecicola]
MARYSGFQYKRFLKNFTATTAVLTVLSAGTYYFAGPGRAVATVVMGQTVSEQGGGEEAVFGFNEGGTYFEQSIIDKQGSEPETEFIHSSETKINLTAEDLEKLSDVNYLKSNFYIVDKRTDLLEGDINPQEFLNMDFTIDKNTEGPKVLIFHTHANEMFADSDPSKGITEGIYGAGERLKEILETEYGIPVLHHDGQYDVVDGKGQITGAYERMEPDIRRVLQDNPTIEVVIDMHRDGVRSDVHLVEEVGGKQCAKIMFFNGLCRLNEDGKLEDLTSLPNTYLKDNLALSFNMQLMANSMYPNFTRKVYLNAYRYSLHMAPKSLLIEVGAQTNTKEEILNSMEPLADILARVLLEE